MKICVNKNIFRSIKKVNNFAKFPKLKYHKRMGITPEFVKKNEKIFTDLTNMYDHTDWLNLALNIQSDLFHEQLFSEIMSDFKIERESKSKIKDIASKSGLNSESVYSQYNDGFNTALVSLLEEMKTMILEEGEKNPEILKADPVWMEKLKTYEGMVEYLEEKEVNITPENRFSFPEINQLYLNLDVSNIVKTFSELYFMGIYDEDMMRYLPHKDAMLDYLNKFEQDVNESSNIVNEMWVSKLKSDTFHYIKLVISDDFKKASTSYAKTEDGFRVDVGLIITRDPIFLE